MAILVKILLSLCFYCQHLWAISGATLPPIYISQEYLPPHTTDSYAEKSSTYNSNSVRQPTYQSKQINKMYHPITQNNNNNFSNSNQSLKKLYNSYAAPASGSAPFVYSMSQQTNLLPLPKLFPKSVVEQLSRADRKQQQQQQQHQQYHQQQLQQQIHVDITKSPDFAQVNTPPLLMVEEPTAPLLTPNQSRTLEAARILASTLLHANDETRLETPGLAPLSNTNSLALPNRLNNTDVLIVKSQKNAYIIPTTLAKDARNPSMVHALYKMRDQLEKAYTINQFIFIIKPEKINFLNKLV